MTDIFKNTSVDKAIKVLSDAFNGLVVAGLAVFAVHAADVKAAPPAAPQQVVEPVQQ